MRTVPWARGGGGRQCVWGLCRHGQQGRSRPRSRVVCVTVGWLTSRANSRAVVGANRRTVTQLRRSFQCQRRGRGRGWGGVGGREGKVARIVDTPPPGRNQGPGACDPRQYAVGRCRAHTAPLEATPRLPLTSTSSPRPYGLGGHLEGNVPRHVLGCPCAVVAGQTLHQGRGRAGALGVAKPAGTGSAASKCTPLPRLPAHHGHAKRSGGQGGPKVHATPCLAHATPCPAPTHRCSVAAMARITRAPCPS